MSGGGCGWTYPKLQMKSKMPSSAGHSDMPVTPVLAEADGSIIQGQPSLQSELEISLGIMRPYFKQNKIKQNKIL